MFDKLDDIVQRFEELLQELNDPMLAMDQNRYRKLMKEHSDLEPIVMKYREYTNVLNSIKESKEILQEESDEELRELAKKLYPD